MPLFEYRCGECEGRSEMLVLAGDAHDTPTCPACGSVEMSRLLSTFAAQAGVGGRPSGGQSFDAGSACGGGPCSMPDVCGPRS